MILRHPLQATLAVAALMLQLGQGSHAQEFIVLNPIADTTLTETYPTNNMGAVSFFNVGSIQNPAGTPPFNYPRNRALLQFDIAGSLPTGAVIQSAVFHFDLSFTPPNDNSNPDQTHNLHRMLRPWGEGSGTNLPSGGIGRPSELGESDWIHRFSGTTNTWGIPGGLAGVDYATNITSATFVMNRAFGPYAFQSSPELISDVQLWMDNPDQNFGWMIKVDDETAPWTAKRFKARESGPFFPRLEIEYVVPVPEPRVVGFLALIAIVFGSRFVRRR